MGRIRFQFNERKAIQTAAHLIHRSGGEMNYLALMKLMYLVDREALVRFGRPITGDRVVAMKHGPVLSSVYDFVCHKKQDLPSSLWHSFIARPMPFVYTVRFGGLPETSALSDAEVALIAEVHARHMGKSEWDLVEFTHRLKEWHNPKSTSVTIPYEDILKAAGASDPDIEAIAEHSAVDTYLDHALAKA